jgi:TonB family protein
MLMKGQYYLCGIAMALAQSADDAAIPIRFRPDVLAAMAVDHQVPKYPLGALKARKGGVAIATIQIDQAGRVASVDVTASPGDDFKLAVNSALLRWTFSPAKLHGVVHPAVGRIVTYFQCNVDGCEVTIPGITDRTK